MKTKSHRLSKIAWWWASRLLPCPGYYKQCCDEHWGARVSFRSGFLGVYKVISLQLIKINEKKKSIKKKNCLMRTVTDSHMSQEILGLTESQGIQGRRGLRSSLNFWQVFWRTSKWKTNDLKHRFPLGWDVQMSHSLLASRLCFRELFRVHCCHSVAKSCPPLCKPMHCSTPGFPVLYYLMEFVQIRENYWLYDLSFMKGTMKSVSDFCWSQQL